MNLMSEKRNLHFACHLALLLVLSVGEGDDSPKSFFVESIDGITFKEFQLRQNIQISEQSDRFAIDYILQLEAGEHIIMSTKSALLLSSYRQNDVIVIGNLNINGFHDGTAKDTRFSAISGLTFTSKPHDTKILVADKDNFCVRECDIVTRRVTTFVGHCTKSNDRNGNISMAYFGEISSITRDIKNRHKLYIFDATYNSIKLVNEVLDAVSPVYQYSDIKTNFAMKFNPYDGKIYIANADEMRAHDSNDLSKNTVILRGNGYRDGTFNRSAYIQPRDFLFLTNTVFLFTDYVKSNLRLVDITHRFVSTICRQGKSKLFQAGNPMECIIRNPSGLLILPSESTILISAKSTLYNLNYTGRIPDRHGFISETTPMVTTADQNIKNAATLLYVIVVIFASTIFFLTVAIIIARCAKRRGANQIVKENPKKFQPVKLSTDPSAHLTSRILTPRSPENKSLHGGWNTERPSYFLRPEVKAQSYLGEVWGVERQNLQARPEINIIPVTQSGEMLKCPFPRPAIDNAYRTIAEEKLEEREFHQSEDLNQLNTIEPDDASPCKQLSKIKQLSRLELKSEQKLKTKRSTSVVYAQINKNRDKTNSKASPVTQVTTKRSST